MRSIRTSPAGYFAVALLCAILAVNAFMQGCGSRARGANTIVPGDSQFSAPTITPSASAVAVSTNTGPNEGRIVGKPLQTVSVSLAWTDESITNSEVAGYHVYYGVGDVALSNYFTVTNWLKTSGLAEITLSNVNPSVEYNIMLNAFDKLGNDSSNTTELTFIAPGYLLAASGTNSFKFSFLAFSNLTYTVQSRAPGATNWDARKTFTNAQGIQTFTDAVPSAAFYRLLIQ